MYQGWFSGFNNIHQLHKMPLLGEAERRELFVQSLQPLKNNKLNKQTNKTSYGTLAKRTKSPFFSWCLPHSRA